MMYFKIFMKFAVASVGTTTRHLVGIDAIVCQFLCCNFAVNVTADISVIYFKCASMFSYD